MKKEAKIIKPRRSLLRDSIWIIESRGKSGYSNDEEEKISYKMIIPLDGRTEKNQERFMIVLYHDISTEKLRGDKPIKPYSYDITYGKIEGIIKNNMRTQYYGRHELAYKVHVNANPADFNLAVPEEYEEREIIHEIIWDEITEPLKEKIKQLKKESPQILYGFSYDEAGKDNRDICRRMYCPICKKTYTTRTGCPVCGANKSYYGSSNVCVDEGFRKFLQEQYPRSSANDVDKLYKEKLKKTEKMYFMTSTETGINLYKIMYECSIKNGIVTEKYVAEYSIEHSIEKKAAYKHLKKGLKEVTAFDVLELNSNNILYPPHIIYDGCENFMEFAMKNEDIMKKIGFIDALKYASDKLQMEAFFLVFIGILNKYPVMEMIIKMGHAKLFFESYNAIKNGGSADEMKKISMRIADLVNNEATKGKDAMRIPVYIGDYLIRKSAGIEEYFNWIDIYELTGITKEQFENITNSIQYAYVNSQVNINKLFNIMKYDYPFQKLLNYLVKVERQTHEGLMTIANNLADYLQMCDLCGVAADKYPSDLRKQHDDMLFHIARVNSEKEEKMLSTIGTQAERYVEVSDEQTVGIPKILNDYVIVFPKSEKDFIEEGNMQHNCVGSYPRNVRNKQCIIFFIRKKDTPNQSFITAECTRRGLGQFFYSNNRRVTDEELIKLGKYVSNKLIRGCKSGAIDSLND